MGQFNHKEIKETQRDQVESCWLGGRTLNLEPERCVSYHLKGKETRINIESGKLG
jgi:hypothetical protein